ncbi:MAG: BrnA antitoxin family protein [Zoogloeaceae bacterium]|nr:BrnA antitoxin family protein [Zoogloeaceae bacterium]
MANDKLTPELTPFERDLLESFRQAKNGEYARVHTPDEIAARRRGRPVGSVKADRKRSTTIRFDHDVLEALKATGRGWQTRVNEVMREWLSHHELGL